MANTKAQPELRKISIATVGTPKEAGVIVSKLSAANIASFLVEEKSFATGRSARRQMGAIKVQVESHDVRQALRCLQTKDGPQQRPTSEGEDERQRTVMSNRSLGGTYSAFLPLGVIVAGLLALALLLLR